MVRAMEYQEWSVYQVALEGAMDVARWTLLGSSAGNGVSQRVVRLSRGICLRLVTAWFVRRQVDVFVERLEEIAIAVAQLQVWLEWAIATGELPPDRGGELYGKYGQILTEVLQLQKGVTEWTAGVDVVLEGSGDGT